MNSNHLINTFTEVKTCIYKNEQYSVRDNGAILRHPKAEGRVRPNDNKWTFGKPNEHTGYMEFNAERVHRIVAFAFLGEPPTPQHVVDHIDTNRRNNRPENLRWLTKLENVLNNPITRRRIELQCGSIENFLNDPTIMHAFADQNPNFEWMRTVSPEEAKSSYEKLLKWATAQPKSNDSNRKSIGEWIYTSSTKSEYTTIDSNFKHTNHSYVQQENSVTENPEPEDCITESLTPNAKQLNWYTPTEFPLCPAKNTDKPLKNYFYQLKLGSVITRNQYSTYYIVDFALHNENLLLVRAHTEDSIKKEAVIYICFKDMHFIHSYNSFFSEEGAEKEFTLAQGLEWDGDLVFDDLIS